MTGYEFHPEARLDLDEIWEFIRADSLDAADRVIAEILSAIRAMVPFPHQGHRRPDLTSGPLRFIRVDDYLIGYAPDEEPLWVIAVLHGKRDPRILAAILRSREGE
jgi:plasmid stabilization system protein ParE